MLSPRQIRILLTSKNTPPWMYRQLWLLALDIRAQLRKQGLSDFSISLDLDGLIAILDGVDLMRAMSWLQCPSDTEQLTPIDWVEIGNLTSKTSQVEVQ